MSSDGLISFARGAPSPDITPPEALRECANRVLEKDAVGALSYGPGSGYGPLRDWIAERHGVDPERVMVTNGSLEAGMFVFDLLVEPGDIVIVESPSYDRTLLGLTERYAALLAIPLESDGIDVGALETIFAAGVEPEFAHIIPNFHNPAGCTLSLAKRERLVRSPRSTISSSSRTTPTPRCRSAATGSRRCCRSTTRTTSSTRARSRRRSPPVSASAT